MTMKKLSRIKLLKAIFGSFFAVICLLSSVIGFTGNTQPVMAVENTENTTVQTAQENTQQNVEQSTSDTPDNTNPSNETPDNDTSSDSDKDKNKITKDNCKSSLGAIGWLVCPTTGKIAEAVDFLYEKIETFLVIDPISVHHSIPFCGRRGSSTEASLNHRMCEFETWHWESVKQNFEKFPIF